MKYMPLKKLYYSKKDEYEKEYMKRTNDISCVSFDIEISGEKLFFVYAPEVVGLLSKILTTNSKIEKLQRMLPGVAYDCYLRNCLVDEIMMTNDIEGVYSTRKEIVDTIENEKSENKHSRFEGLITKYLMLLDTDLWEISLNTCEDIRNLYNDIVLDEIGEHDKPDGEIFRKDAACVISVTQREKHRGIVPESKIIEYMTKTLEIFDFDHIPLLAQVAVVHYLIGYIHPFYDGNGRLSRFLSSYMLQKDLNTLIALRLAYAIKNDKIEYYKAFDLCNEKKNRGDITPFIIMFLTMLDKAARSIYERLDEGIEQLSYYNSLVEKIENEDKRNAVFLLIQNALFDSEKFDMTSMMRLLKCSYGKAKKILDDLMLDGMPVKKERIKKYFFSVDLDEIADYLKSY